jgi:hypothetical protein
MSYPVWWETTLTIYNKYEDPITNLITWYRTVVEGAFWKYVGDKITINDVVLETDNTICRIRKDARFLPRHEWIALPNDVMSDYFTLGKGDIIVKDEVDDDINEYQSGKRSTDLLSKYKNLQGCITVEEIAIDTGAGRCNEHYRVKGI